MSGRTDLLRMIFLISFLIILLIILSIQLSNQSYKKNNFSEKIELINKDKMFLILMHTINIDENLISGYSIKYDSMMTFNLNEQKTKSFYTSYDKISISPQHCISCHNNKYDMKN